MEVSGKVIFFYKPRCFFYFAKITYLYHMKDLFSTQAKDYAAYRPTYGESIYEFLLEHTAHRDLAWDCATGNGQVAQSLSPHFKQILATDISQNQLDQATAMSNIQYSRQAAEKTDFLNHSVDLITVGQALHWLEFDIFFTEVKRVAKPDAFFAAWGYELCDFDIDDITNAFLNFYHYDLNGYWSPERKHIEDQYASIDFPFKMVDTPRFNMTKKWHLYEFEGYLNSWSAVQNYIRDNGSNPVKHLITEIEPLWGEFSRQHVYFPIFMKAGYVS